VAIIRQTRYNDWSNEIDKLYEIMNTI
jgi:hypothetical protein